MLSPLEVNHLTKILSKSYVKQALTAFQQQNYALSASLFYYLQQRYPNVAGLRFKLALAQMQVEFWPGAQQAFEELLTAKDPDILCNLGICHWKQNQLKQALRYFNYNMAHFPAHFDTQINLAAFYLQFKRVSQAIGLYQNILHYKPKYHEIRFNLATCLQQQMRYAEAIYEYRQILVELPKHYNSLYNLANIHYQLKDYQAAKFYWETCLKLQPKNLELRFWCHYLEQTGFKDLEHESYVKTIFDHYAQGYDEHLSSNLNYQLPMYLTDYFKQSFHPQQFHRSLDLGCGTGLCAQALKSFSLSLVGVDLSAEMLKQAQKRYIYDELHHLSMLEFLKQEDRRFDIILLADVLPYVKDLKTLLQKISEHLSHKGHLIFSSELTQTNQQEFQTTLRYAFASTYLQEIGQQSGLQLLSSNQFGAREQNHLPVIQGIYHWQKI